MHLLCQEHNFSELAERLYAGTQKLFGALVKTAQFSRSGPVGNPPLSVHFTGRFAPEEIRKFAVFHTIVYYEIGGLADLQRTNPTAAPQTVRSIDGSGGDRFGRRHLHL